MVLLKHNLQNRALATCGSVASLGSPGPALFLARTRNWYVLPSFNPCTRALGSADYSFSWGYVGKIRVNMFHRD